MIPAGVQVYVASMPVDFRKGATGLMALVRYAYDEDRLIETCARARRAL
jgi:hypothetical protein